MNEHQNRLLILLKEIDDICSKHDITYYCTGGTLIGAVRHGGFIPWDDDIDVYMFRDDFFRFAKAFESECPDNRAITFSEQNADYHSTIPRYVDTESTVFCKYHMLGHAPAGTLIDVFILDPIPKEYESKKNYLDKFFVYCDLVMPFYSFSHRSSDDNYDLFQEYLDFSEENGEALAIAKLKEELFTLDIREHDNVMLRWGSIPSVFPKDMFGEPVFMPFEDMRIPVPAKWYDYLVQLYGADWMNIPYVETQDTHDNIKRYDISYPFFYQKRDEMIDPGELKKAYYNRKHCYREYEREKRKAESQELALISKLILKGIENMTERRGCSVRDLFERKEYETIIYIFSQYLDVQTRIKFMGKLNHTYYHRWLYPLVIDLPVEYLDVLLKSLLAENKIRIVEKIVGLYSRKEIENAAVSNAKTELDAINKAALLYYTGKYEDCIEFCDSVSDNCFNARIKGFKMLSTVGLGNDSDPDHAVAMDGSVPTDEMKKAFGDSLYLRGEKEQAEKVYKDLMKTCRNGLFYNDIIQKVNIDPIPLEEEEKYVPDSINKIEKMLIDEIVDICRDNDIKYVLGPHLSRRLFICGNFGYEDEKKNIYMDAENAQKFINAFEKINGESRALLSWLNNSKINDMVLKYVFTDSVLLDPYDNQINSERLGVNINIIIIRSGMADKNYRRVTRLKEHAVHNTGLLSRAGLFRQIMKKEPGYKQGNYYFFTNSKGEKPLRRKYHDEDWNEVGTIEYEGRTYAVPKAALDVYFRNEVKKSNKRKETDISQYWFTSVSWDELDGFDGNLGVYAERLVELNNKKTESNFRTDVFWKRMLCVNDSMRINDKYAGSIEEMERALAEGAYDHLGSLLTEVNELACMYIKRNVYLDIDERIWNCYVGFLEGTGQHKLANKMKAKEEIK